MHLSAGELEQFRERGYLVVKGLVDAEAIARLQVEVDGLHERMAEAVPEDVGVTWEDLPADRPPRIRQLMHSERVCPTIEAVLSSDAMLDVIEDLVGPEIMLYHSKLMMKAAGDGTFTPWHQDWGYWRTQSKEPTQVNGMLAIDASTLENGCIRFVPGSHAQGAIEHTHDPDATGFGIGLPGDLDAYENEAVELEPGDVVFFGALVIHGSAPNQSSQHRRANTFAFDKVGNWIKSGRTERVLRGRQLA